MRVIEITESKLDKMSDLAEEMLTAVGRLMHCISELGEESGLNMRMGDGDYRSMSTMRRRHERDDYDGDDFGERRRRYRY